MGETEQVSRDRHVIEGPNARDQIAFYAYDCHSFVVKSIRMPATYLCYVPE